MAGKYDHEVLRKFVASLGFQLDDQEYKRFKGALDTLSKRMVELGEVAVGAATVIGTSVTAIASKLEKLYYSSQRTGASAQNLQAFQYGAEQIGLTANDASAAVENLARTTRLNPGLIAYLKLLNVNPNQDSVKVLIDLVDRLRRMPFYVAAPIARMFGLDDNTLIMMEKNFDRLKQAMEESKKTAPIDDEQVKKMHEFMERIRELGMHFERLSNIIAGRFLPAVEPIITWAEEMIHDLIELDKATDGWSSRLVGLIGAVGATVTALGLLRGAASVLGIMGGAAGAAGGAGAAAGGAVAGAAAGAAARSTPRLLGGFFGRMLGPIATGVAGGLLAKYGVDTLAYKWQKGGEALTGEVHATDVLNATKALQSGYYAPGTTLQDVLSGKAKRTTAQVPGIHQLPENVSNLIDFYAKSFGIDPALLKAQAYQESRGKQGAVSRKGALGVFQLMPATAEAMGGDPKNLTQNIQMGVRKMSELLKQYGGNIPMALAAYNAGEGNVKKYGGVPPFAETRGYISSILGDVSNFRGNTVHIDQKTTIHVDGSGDPAQVGTVVRRQQEAVNSDLIRNTQGALR